MEELSALSLACAPRQKALTPRGDQLSTPVGVISHHRSNVDVYLPLYPSVDSYVRLVVEKYAGLSTVSLQTN